MAEVQMFTVRDFEPREGGLLPEARLVYTTHGTLNAERSNAILFPTHYGGTHVNNEWLIQDGRALDPRQYFIIVPNMLGNGVSSSPSNTPAPFAGTAFPHITVEDNVRLQRHLVTEHFGIERLQLVVGFSMGAQQSYEWAVSFPEMTERCVPICGSARTSPHNYVFLEGVTAALKADAAWQDGTYDRPPVRGLRAMGRVWAGWGVSQAFYREHVYLQAGYTSLEDYIVRNWENSFLAADANNLLAMAWTWQHADIGATPGFNGSFERALASITARTLVMPGATDLYFPPEDGAYEVEHIHGAELRVIPSVWGHGAGAGPNPADAAFVDGSLKEWLAR
jgi:homoserine O-acetyltransferase